jgi:hypothetical protein
MGWFGSIGGAVRRAGRPIGWVAVAYAVGVSVGAIAAHASLPLALRDRDRIVGAAAQSQVMRDLHRGERVSAALGDFAGNLGRGAVPYTVMGLAVVLPFPLVVYQGWVGGIVSVDGQHLSRFRSAAEALYYVSVMLLQLVPYSLAVGAGVRLGLGFSMPKGRYGYSGGERWLGLPAEGVRDVARIYVLVVPLFLVASLVEFLAR